MMGTGGGPTMYKYNTPSGDKSMDGLGMALRFGLPLRDMEMVQFHPTGLLAGDHTRMTGTVLEEGLRGAGGQLLNARGERFMFDYDGRGERATRDVVSRGIYAEMRKNNNPEQIGMFISMSHLGPDVVRQKFPGMVKRCADSGFDLAAGKVEVVPTAHYFMGGVVVAPDTSTAMEGFYVAGEDAGGAHGANRLGGNGVANSTVFGGIAGDTMGAAVRNMRSLRDIDEHVLAAEMDRALQPLMRPAAPVQPLRAALQDAMWEDVGVMRSRAGLERGLKRVEAVQSDLHEAGIDGANLAFNMTWHDWLNLRSLVDVSEVIARAALERENSRGAHFREDFPEVGDLESSYFTLAQKRGEDLTLSRAEVAFTIVRPGQTVLPDDAPATLVAAQ
ncbi:FAD-binding protein (plasmid) [Paracoccus pantotrophus]|nr:FAD-binding protein [Paracoccus pantotrophus]